ncbi:hypothetical protein ACI65C_006563 [Semiaphis heraclei]
MSKEKKAKGIGHISLRKKVVPPRLTGPDCLCRKKCFVNVVDEDRISLISILNNIGDKSKQDTFLGGLIHLNQPVFREVGMEVDQIRLVLYSMKLFLQKYESDFWSVYSEERETVTMKPRVKYPYFAKYFASINFNISFAYPRSDTCQTCDQLLKSIQNETDAEEKASLNVEKEVYLRKAQVFYTYLKQLGAEAKENNSIIDVLSFDFQQNMPLTHITSGDVFYKKTTVVVQFLNTFS